MLREEAEREAARRNLEDPDRARYEFYAFDESAGFAADAWDVATRLREGPPPTAQWPAAGPQTPAGGAAEPASEEEPVFLEGPTVAEVDPFAGPDPFVEPHSYDVPLPHEEPKRDKRDGRPGGFVRGVGGAVILAGVLWTTMVVVLATMLKPNDLTSYGVFAVAAVAGLLATGLGVAILRS